MTTPSLAHTSTTEITFQRLLEAISLLTTPEAVLTHLTSHTPNEITPEHIEQFKTTAVFLGYSVGLKRLDAYLHLVTQIELVHVLGSSVANAGSFRDAFEYVIAEPPLITDYPNPITSQ